MEEKYMLEAVKEAEKALNGAEVPVGAVIVYKNKIIAKGYNKKETMKNGLMHAELIAINKTCTKLSDWRLNECVLYTTLFPCPMCASAIQQSRIKKIYYILESNDIYSFELSKKILNNPKSPVEFKKIEIETNLLKEFFYKIRLK